MSRTGPARAEAERLLAGAASLGLELDGDGASALLSYLDLVYRWNPSAGLTRVARADAVRLHLLDSLSLAAHIDTSGPLVDLGSGGGFPGLPLALGLPGLEAELVDSRRRCCSFLVQAVAELGLSDRVRVRELGAGQLTGPYQTVVSRAFLPPPELVSLAVGLLAPGGRLLVMASGKARLRVEDLVENSEGLLAGGGHDLVLPGGDEGRSILVLVRPQ